MVVVFIFVWLLCMNVHWSTATQKATNNKNEWHLLSRHSAIVGKHGTPSWHQHTTMTSNSDWALWNMPEKIQFWSAVGMRGIIWPKQYLGGFYGPKNIHINTWVTWNNGNTWNIRFYTRTLNCSHEPCHSPHLSVGLVLSLITYRHIHTLWKIST